MSLDNIIKLAEYERTHSGIPPTAEDTIARLFAEQHALELRYVAEWGKWMVYDGARWSHDNTLNVFDKARAICRAVAASCDEKLASATTSAKTVAAVERLARTDRRLAAVTSQWDANGWFLNTGDDAAAATFDLRTGVDGAPDALDFISKKTEVGCAPAGTPHPLWTKFLNRVTGGSDELQGFLQRYIGYCCTGFTTEHVFVFAYGTGANGKGTFINTIAKILGDYATVADMGTFITSTSERHPTDLAKLRGARLVVAQETQKGRRWDETKIKTLTGGDKITARFMRQDFFDFDPTFKLFIGGNHKPRLANTDEAMRRRLLMVPFTVQIPKAERDRHLPEKLKAEWPAILRWCIEGCLEWQRIGLAPPASVLAATAEYFATQDTLQQWLDDCIEDGGPYAFTRTSGLFASWKGWAEGHNLKAGSTQNLSESLADRGFPKARDGNGQRGFKTLTVRSL